MNAVAPFLEAGRAPELRLFRSALDVCPEGLAIVEAGRILYANAAFASTFACDSVAAIQGRKLASLIPRDHPCLCNEIAAPASLEAPRGSSTCEFQLSSGGAAVPIQISCSRFQSDGRALLLVAARDVTRKERRRVIRDSDRRYRAIFDAAAIGILQCTTEGRVIESNPAAQRMLGYTKEELRGMHFRDFTHPDDYALDLGLFQEMVEGKRDYYQVELRYVGKHDTSGWVRLTVSSVSGPDGHPASVIGMAEDITEHKRTESQLREAQKMEVIGRLVGGVAHDFNNLLTGIMLYCDLLREGLKGESRLRHHAEEIRLAGEQGAALVQQLLSVSRPQPVNPRILSLNEIVTAMRNLLDRLIGEDIRLEITLAPDLWPVEMDPAQVQQIILNLALNARDAMPSGGRVRVETRNTPANGSSEGIELLVSDNGCGMSAEVRSHLFEPFFTTKRPGQGNGLGLATVHNIVRQYGGSIAVDSELGRGTRFQVRLPRAEAGCAEVRFRQEQLSLGAERKTILVVEDNSVVRRSAVKILEECGYYVLEASSGHQALKLCRRHGEPIDLLLVDLVMPGMSGREVARQLRTTRPNLRVIYTSGYDQAVANGDSEPIVVFRKPFTGGALLQKIREVLHPIPVSTVTEGSAS